MKKYLLIFAFFIGAAQAQTTTPSPCLAGGLVEGSIQADDGTIIPAAMVKKPLVSKTHDCRTNTMSYPFLGGKGLKGGIWITPQSADLILKGDGWRQVDVSKAKKGDVFLIRTKGKITQIFKVVVVASDVIETNTYHFTLSYKDNDLVVKRRQFAYEPEKVIQEKGKSFEFWSPKK